MLQATKVDVPMSIEYLSGKNSESKEKTSEKTSENKPTVTNIEQDKRGVKDCKVIKRNLSRETERSK